MKNERCAINFEIFLLDILSCKGAFRLHVSSESNLLVLLSLFCVLVYTKTYMFREQRDNILKKKKYSAIQTHTFLWEVLFNKAITVQYPILYSLKLSEQKAISFLLFPGGIKRGHWTITKITLCSVIFVPFNRVFLRKRTCILEVNIFLNFNELNF